MARSGTAGSQTVGLVADIGISFGFAARRDCSSGAVCGTRESSSAMSRRSLRFARAPDRIVRLARDRALANEIRMPDLVARMARKIERAPVDVLDEAVGRVMVHCWSGCRNPARGRRVLTCGIAVRKPARGRLRRDYWRQGPESNRRTRLCRPLHNHSATPPRVHGAFAENDRRQTSTSRVNSPTRARRHAPARKLKREAWLPFGIWSGRRVSNSRPQPWQGCALPTELLPRALQKWDVSTHFTTVKLSARNTFRKRRALTSIRSGTARLCAGSTASTKPSAPPPRRSARCRSCARRRRRTADRGTAASGSPPAVRSS